MVDRSGKANNKEWNEIRFYKCKICKFKSNDIDELKYHMLGVHAGVEILV